MTRARTELISLDDTPYYHCISRCVRRAFLCGEDTFTGKNFEHRKAWIIERLSELDSVFSIDIAAYSIMSNHYHLVLRVDKQAVERITNEAVMQRWQKLFSIPLLVSRYFNGETTSKAERIEAEKVLSLWRERLCDISWFMRCLNEHLARRANEEDNCTGRFWEGRFTSQPLLDEAAVLTCMSYVDLNPIRASMAESPEQSDFTSVQQRIRQSVGEKPLSNHLPSLMSLIKQSKDKHRNAIGFTTNDYLQLVDWAGRAVRAGKRGSIPSETPHILARLGLEPEGYINHLRGHRGKPHPLVMGHVEKIKEAAQQLGQCFIKGMSEARRLYCT